MVNWDTNTIDKPIYKKPEMIKSHSTGPIEAVQLSVLCVKKTNLNCK